MVAWVGSLVSVLPNHFGGNNRKDRYFHIVLCLTQDHTTCVKWFEDDTVSTEDLVLLTLKVEITKERNQSSLLEYNPIKKLCVILKILTLPQQSTWKKTVIQADESTPGPSKPKRKILPKNYNEDEDAESDSDIEEEKENDM